MKEAVAIARCGPGPDSLRRLSHDAVNILDSFLFNLQTIWPDGLKQGILTGTNFATSVRPLHALRKAMEDLSTLAQCERPAQMEWEAVNWKSIIADKLAIAGKRSMGQVEFSAEASDFSGFCYPVLVGRAIGNLLWLTHNFSISPAHADLSIESIKGEPWIHFAWRIDWGSALRTDGDFPNFEPFYPLRPKNTLALEETTGLALWTVKKIAEAHGGSLTATGDALPKILWRCPKGIAGRNETP
jgi:K+-sensing histidine kinase KdpD